LEFILLHVPILFAITSVLYDYIAAVIVNEVYKTSVRSTVRSSIKAHKNSLM